MTVVVKRLKQTLDKMLLSGLDTSILHTVRLEWESDHDTQVISLFQNKKLK